MHFRLLGPVDAVVEGRQVHLGRRRERFLLAVLLLEAGRPVPVARLAELLSDSGAARAPRDAIYGYVSRLRRCLAPMSVELTSTPAGYAVPVDPELVDAHRFSRLVSRARATGDLAERAELIDLALSLWRGPALVDVASNEVRERLCGRLEEERFAAIELLLATSQDDRAPATVVISSIEGMAGIGKTALGRHDQARQHWRRTLDILADLGLTEIEEVDAAEIRARLAELDQTS